MNINLHSLLHIHVMHVRACLGAFSDSKSEIFSNPLNASVP